MHYDDLEEMTKLRRAIDSAERDLHHTEGRLDILRKQLMEVAGTENSDDAKVIISDMNATLSRIRAEIRQKIEALKEAYEW